MHTPVVFIIFNRPQTTERVFAEIAKAKPQKLFVIADGPREGWLGEAEKCATARAIVERVDWDCQVFKNYSDVNLGCGSRVSTGINWVFEQVEEAIILEDDCVPHPTFFRFCQEMLDKYRDDERIMHVNGNNFQFGHKRTPYSYYFSWHNICWGWATWRRAWQHYDIAVKLWPDLRDTSWLLDIVENPRAAAYWQDIFDRAYTTGGNIGTWDYQWTFACWVQHGLSISPNNTLVSNIGFGDDATHTTWAGSPMAHLPSFEMTFPLRYPSCMVRNSEADQYFIESVIVSKILGSRSRRRISTSIPQLLQNIISRFRSKGSSARSQ